MKKFLISLLTVMMVIGMVSCSEKKEKPEPKDPVFEVEKVVSGDGVEFVPDLTVKGEVTDYLLKNKEIIICGEKYTFPVKISDLEEKGWKLTVEEPDREFESKSRTTLSGFYMEKEDGSQIELGKLYNESDSSKKLSECSLIEIEFDNLTSETTKIDFELPGGIVRNSTASDVLSKYGDPNNTELFTEHSYNHEKQLTYNKHKDSGLNFSYVFEEDGKLSYAKVGIEVE